MSFYFSLCFSHTHGLQMGAEASTLEIAAEVEKIGPAYKAYAELVREHAIEGRSLSDYTVPALFSLSTHTHVQLRAWTL